MDVAMKIAVEIQTVTTATGIQIVGSGLNLNSNKRTHVRLCVKGEPGAILPLVVGFIVVLMMMVYVAVDVSSMQAAEAQVKQFGRIASLAAIRTYFSERETHNHATALQNTVDIVNALTEENRLLAGMGDAGVLTLDEQGEGALLQPGWWLTSQSACDEAKEGVASLSTCPAGESSYPFFHESTLSDFDGDQNALTPSAFRITGRFLPDGISLLMSQGFRYLNIDAFHVSVTAVASYIPRKIIFALDLSPSITYDTHKRWTEGGPFGPSSEPTDCCPSLSEAHGNLYAFFTCYDNYQNYCQSQQIPFHLGEIAQIDKSWLQLTNQIWNEDDQAFELKEATEWNPSPSFGSDVYTHERPPNTAAEGHNSYHFGNDYVLRAVVGDSDAPTGSCSSYANEGDPYEMLTCFHANPSDYPIGENMERDATMFARVDFYRDEHYRGPQPLTTILTTVRNALVEFRDGNQRIPGDSAALFGFDTKTSWNRFIPFHPKNLDYLQQFLDLTVPVGSFDPTSNLDDDLPNHAFDPNGDTEASLGSGLDRLARLGFLPVRAASTDLREALLIAGNELKRERLRTSATAAEHIILFTDGLTVCNYTGAHKTCRFNLETYQAAVEDFEDFLSNNQAGSSSELPSAQIHTIVFGDGVGPHTLMMPHSNTSIPTDGRTQPPGGGNAVCMTDNEFRMSQSPGGETDPQPFVAGVQGDMQGAWDAMLDGQRNAFPQALIPLYNAASSSAGIFGPIRPRASGCQEIYDDSNSGSESYDDWFLDPTEYFPLCRDNAYLSDGDFDDVGRLFVDPYCRSPAEQVKQYLKEIMGESPFSIVQIQ